MPKKMRRLALKGGLTVKAQEGKILVLDGLEMEEPKTKEMLTILKNLKVEDSALILLPERNANVERSARNIPGVKTLRANYLNLRDLLGHDWLIMPLGALRVIEGILA
jgi:large subunit ribosomal protein L4